MHVCVCVYGIAVNHSLHIRSVTSLYCRLLADPADLDVTLHFLGGCLLTPPRTAKLLATVDEMAQPQHVAGLAALLDDMWSQLHSSDSSSDIHGVGCSGGSSSANNCATGVSVISSKADARSRAGAAGAGVVLQSVPVAGPEGPAAVSEVIITPQAPHVCAESAGAGDEARGSIEKEADRIAVGMKLWTHGWFPRVVVAVVDSLLSEQALRRWVGGWGEMVCCCMHKGNDGVIGDSTGVIGDSTKSMMEVLV